MLFIQLIFQHVLRVRLNTASPEAQDEKVDDDKAGTGTGTATPVSEGRGETLVDTADGQQGKVDTARSLASGATATQPATPSSPAPLTSSKPSKGNDLKEKYKARDRKKEANAGAVINLVTVDVDFVNSVFDPAGRTCFSSLKFEMCLIC
jgi:hypothetical protein